MQYRTCLVTTCLLSACGVGEPQPSPYTGYNTQVAGCTASQVGEQRCYGSFVQQCSAYHQWVTEEDCSAIGAVCEIPGDGPATCIDADPCTDGHQRCADDILKLCADGVWQSVQDCSTAGHACVETSDTNAGCAAEGCAAGATRCNVEVLETCEQGNWIVLEKCLDGGKTCETTSSTSAQCSDTPTCVSGYQRCTGNLLEACSGNGWVTSDDCAAGGQTCVETSPSSAECQAPGCTTAHQRCNGHWLEVCEAGEWRLFVDCNSSNEACAQTGGTTAECRCVPDCGARVCGNDGCGGTCGSCTTGTCDTATGTCVVGADELRVELRWDTNTDLDLRLVKEDGGYCDGSSCYYENCSPGDPNPPEWDGNPGRTTGDPVLETDDTDGHGPEIIRLEDPQDTSYRVSAHYYPPLQGGQDTWATLRFFVGDQLIAEKGRMLVPGDLWEPWQIDWQDDEGVITPLERYWQDWSCGSPTQSCANNSQCPVQQYCSLPDGLCVDGCRDDASCTGACGASAMCVCDTHHRCVDPNSPTVNQPCTIHADCSSDELCGYDNPLTGFACEGMGSSDICARSCRRICDPLIEQCPAGQTCGGQNGFLENIIMELYGDLLGLEPASGSLCY
ncbi:hypothetical protein ACFL6C_01660 [Myxococcota bacterium]